MHKLVRKQELTDEQVQKLKLINIDGTPSEHRISVKGFPQFFEKMLGKLNSYVRQYGPDIHPRMADQGLYKWVLLQQQRISASVISTKEYSALIKTGFKMELENSSFLKEVKHN